ncbi:hypothetical protein [Haladaptatus sp. DFWS20]|uniref:hypothetical protein n=1 Tax=Haladaptatus sp. DFWS20 TaxID=3403467 RepID=UPI003EC0E5C8
MIPMPNNGFLSSVESAEFFSEMTSESDFPSTRRLRQEINYIEELALHTDDPIDYLNCTYSCIIGNLLSSSAQPSKREVEKLINEFTDSMIDLSTLEKWEIVNEISVFNTRILLSISIGCTSIIFNKFFKIINKLFENILSKLVAELDSVSSQLGRSLILSHLLTEIYNHTIYGVISYNDEKDAIDMLDIVFISADSIVESEIYNIIDDDSTQTFKQKSLEQKRDEFFNSLYVRAFVGFIVINHNLPIRNNTRDEYEKLIIPIANFLSRSQTYAKNPDQVCMHIFARVIADLTSYQIQEKYTPSPSSSLVPNTPDFENIVIDPPDDPLRNEDDFLWLDPLLQQAEHFAQKSPYPDAVYSYMFARCISNFINIYSDSSIISLENEFFLEFIYPQIREIICRSKIAAHKSTDHQKFLSNMYEGIFKCVDIDGDVKLEWARLLTKELADDLM